MYRLGELSDEQRSRIGWGLMLLGTLGLAVGIFFVHAGQFTPEDSAGVFEILSNGWAPRWVVKGIGYLIVFGASQMLLAGAAIRFVLNLPMTWARAGFAAFIAWVELVMIFGIVPSEWLNLAQTDLDWSPQRVAFTVPPWLVLGNQLDISWAAIKDAISGTYNLVMLVAAAVFAYKLQDVGKPRPAADKPAVRISPYGRPLVRGGE